MKRAIAELFVSPRVARVANVALWTMLAVMGVGGAVASIAYVVMDTDHCLAFRFLCIGFGLVGLGPIIGAGVAFPEWRSLSARIRISALVLGAWGIAFIAMTVRLAAHYEKCWS